MKYDRQIPIFGTEGQRSIKLTHVAVAGCGGLGCNVITELAMAGIGRMTIIDFDDISDTDMNRQFVHCNKNGSKVDSMKEWVEKISDCKVNIIRDRLTDDNVLDFISDADVIADCLDNNRSRKILNKGVVKAKKPMVHAAVNSMYGQVTFIIPGKTPCLSCFLGKDVEENYSVSSSVGTIGSIQATEILKYITKKGEILTGKLLTADLSSNRYEVIDIKRNEKCEVCSR